MKILRWFGPNEWPYFVAAFVLLIFALAYTAGWINWPNYYSKEYVAVITYGNSETDTVTIFAKTDPFLLNGDIRYQDSTGRDKTFCSGVRSFEIIEE